MTIHRDHLDRLYAELGAAQDRVRQVDAYSEKPHAPQTVSEIRYMHSEMMGMATSFEAIISGLIDSYLSTQEAAE